jgi:UDP-N-acetylglucosamine 2-epimerase
MYDAIVRFAPVAAERSTLIERLGLAGAPFFVATVHRPYNADDGGALAAIVEAFGRLGRPIVFPVHPRTRGRIEALGLALPANVIAIEPVGYLDMLALLAGADLVLTDSGGLQKEACFAGTPCVTLRPETEWVETIEAGWNRLAWGSAEAILEAADRQAGARPAEPFSAYGAGDAAKRIAELLRVRGEVACA